MATAPILEHRTIGASGHPLTEEQERIIALPPTETRKWMAFAGCAKTTTSVEYTHAHPMPALYLAFNKSIASDAKGRFPSYVHVQTAHGYAFSQMDVRRYDDRHMMYSMKPEHLDPVADRIRPMSRMTDVAMRRAILKCLTAYVISSDTSFGEKHMDGFPIALRGAALSMTKHVIERILSFEDSGMMFNPDVYLKAFQLRGRIEEKFRYIILDEAQDLNPVLIAIAKQSGVPCMVVGDPHQSIYRFRGAEQAMDHFPGEALTLSHSFRFGPKVASVANFLLKQSTNRPDHPLMGNPAKDTKVQAYEGSLKGRATILARTNMRIFESLVQIPHTFHVVGGVKEMIDLVEAGYHLWCESKGKRAMGQKPFNPKMVKFKSWDAVVESSEHDEEPELIRLVKIMDAYQEKVPEIIKGLRERSCDREEDARFIVSTAHKAKGREWETVVLLDDYFTPGQLRAMRAKKRITSLEYDQEINLLYVAATRAIGMLMISAPLFDEIAAGTGLPRY
jgi:F-box protein 18 (helicase)